MVRLAAGLLAILTLAACLPAGPFARSDPYAAGPQPGFPRLGTALPAGHTRYSHDSLADLLTRLTHDLEWGARRRNLVRYEAPISVSLSGPGAAQYTAFVGRYLSEIRGRTGIDIALASRANRPITPNLLVQFIPGSEFRSELPEHVCVVAPGRLSWPRFRTAPKQFGGQAFETQRRVDAMSVFIPDTLEPYLARTCLIEEIAQALGPANDLYGLGPSIFNDDGAHIWPTRLDYLMLQVLYAPEMRTGLSRRETRDAARRALVRLNPQGAGASPLPRLRQRDMKRWAKEIATVFDRSNGTSTRQQAARAAVGIASSRAPGSAYHCRALAALVRVTGDTPDKALAAIDRALQVCTRAHGPNDIRITRLKLDRARMLFARGDHREAAITLEPLETPLAAHGQDERLVAFYALQAASLRAIQQSKRSFEARRRAGEWGAYALGSDHPDVARWLSQ
ncbi:MAG: DUF2927 domain-containing protein [Pseudomonadota bacterium]